MQLVERCWDTYYDVIEGREADREYNSIKTWFKHEENLNYITMCGKTTINAPFMQVLSVFAEIDLLDSFIDSFEKIDVLETLSDFRLLTRDRLKMPFPLQYRDMITIGIGVAIKEEKSVMLAMRSIVDDEYFGSKLPNADPNYTRIILNYGFYLITYKDDSSCELTLATNVDPNVAVIPSFILNTFLREIAYYIVLNFKERIEAIDKTVYNQRRENRKEFYDNIEKRVAF